MSVSPYYKQMMREIRSPLFWRDVFAEFIGTFLLMSVQAALPLNWSSDKLGNVVQVSVMIPFHLLSFFSEREREGEEEGEGEGGGGGGRGTSIFVGKLHGCMPQTPVSWVQILPRTKFYSCNALNLIHIPNFSYCISWIEGQCIDTCFSSTTSGHCT